MRSVVPIHPSADVVPLARFDIHDLETIRLLLRGNSVVDWVRLHIKSDEEIDAFIRVNELDPDDREDRARLTDLMRRSVAYLEQHLRYKVPASIREADDVRVLFRCAAQTTGRRADRLHACNALKVMHIIQHTEGRELLLMLPLSDAELAVLLHAKIERVVRGLLERSFPIVEFTGNRKTKNSVYSKLLAKKDTQSAQILDKLRFRFITERLEDIPPLLLAMTRELVPFNYLVPGQAYNSLVDVDRMLIRAGNMTAIRSTIEEDLTLNEAALNEVQGNKRNEFSGPDYRIVNFVADVPLRVDRVVPFNDPRFKQLGPVVYGGVEFQIVDRVTAEKNESGDNRHKLYKLRQRAKVRQRLEAGRRGVRQIPSAPGPDTTGPMPPIRGGS